MYDGTSGVVAHDCHLGNNLYLAQSVADRFQPVEILFFRFVMGLIALLLLIYPRCCSCLALGWSSPGLQTRSTCSTSFS